MVELGPVKEGLVGYQPRSPYYVMYEQSQKEVEQLQVANNELTAENSKLKNDLRAVSHPETELSVEAAEDELWKAQDKLKEAQDKLRGYATFAGIAGPGAGVFFWGMVVSGHDTLSVLLFVFGAVFALVFLSFGFLALESYIKQIPAQKRKVASKQRHLDRLTLRQLGL